MAKTKTKLLIKQIYYILIAIVLLFAYFPNTASAAQITPRKVTIGNSLASASTTYAFTFTVPSSTVIQSASFTACDAASGACTRTGAASGFSVTGVTLTGQPTNLGDASGWTVNTATAGSLRLVKSGDVAAPTGAQTVSFSNVTNPSASNSTFFIFMTTYSDAAWATPIDTGTVATSTAGQITVTASVAEALTFTLTAATVTLSPNPLTTSSTGVGTSSMTASTNGATGYSISYTGTTLTSGTSTINAMAGAASSQNSKQFGMNLRHNTTLGGTDVSGSGSGTYAAGYGTPDSFKFNSGDSVATAAAPTASNTFTVDYIANIDGSTAGGTYTSVLTYVATANF